MCAAIGSYVRLKNRVQVVTILIMTTIRHTRLNLAEEGGLKLPDPNDVSDAEPARRG